MSVIWLAMGFALLGVATPASEVSDTVGVPTPELVHELLNTDRLEEGCPLALQILQRSADDERLLSAAGYCAVHGPGIVAGTALALVEELAAQHPLGLEAAALAMMLSGDVAGAEAAYLHVLREHGPTVRTLLGLGKLEADRGDFALARQAYLEAVELASEPSEAEYRVAFADAILAAERRWIGVSPATLYAKLAALAAAWPDLVLRLAATDENPSEALEGLEPQGELALLKALAEGPLAASSERFSTESLWYYRYLLGEEGLTAQVRLGLLCEWLDLARERAREDALWLAAAAALRYLLDDFDSALAADLIAVWGDLRVGESRGHGLAELMELSGRVHADLLQDPLRAAIDFETSERLFKALGIHAAAARAAERAGSVERIEERKAKAFARAGAHFEAARDSFGAGHAYYQAANAAWQGEELESSLSWAARSSELFRAGGFDCESARSLLLEGSVYLQSDVPDDQDFGRGLWDRLAQQSANNRCNLDRHFLVEGRLLADREEGKAAAIALETAEGLARASGDSRLVAEVTVELAKLDSAEERLAGLLEAVKVLEDGGPPAAESLGDGHLAIAVIFMENPSSFQNSENAVRSHLLQAIECFRMAGAGGGLLDALGRYLELPGIPQAERQGALVVAREVLLPRGFGGRLSSLLEDEAMRMVRSGNHAEASTLYAESQQLVATQARQGQGTALAQPRHLVDTSPAAQAGVIQLMRSVQQEKERLAAMQRRLLPLLAEAGSIERMAQADQTELVDLLQAPHDLMLELQDSVDEGLQAAEEHLRRVDPQATLTALDETAVLIRLLDELETANHEFWQVSKAYWTSPSDPDPEDPLWPAREGDEPAGEAPNVDVSPRLHESLRSQATVLRVLAAEMLGDHVMRNAALEEIAERVESSGEEEPMSSRFDPRYRSDAPEMGSETLGHAIRSEQLAAARSARREAGRLLEELNSDDPMVASGVATRSAAIGEPAVEALALARAADLELLSLGKQWEAVEAGDGPALQRARDYAQHAVNRASSSNAALTAALEVYLRIGVRTGVEPASGADLRRLLAAFSSWQSTEGASWNGMYQVEEMADELLDLSCRVVPPEQYDFELLMELDALLARRLWMPPPTGSLWFNVSPAARAWRRHLARLAGRPAISEDDLTGARLDRGSATEVNLIAIASWQLADEGATVTVPPLTGSKAAELIAKRGPILYYRSCSSTRVRAYLVTVGDDGKVRVSGRDIRVREGEAEQFRSKVANDDGSGAAIAMARELYDALIGPWEPALADVNRIVLISEGWISGVPFVELRDPAGRRVVARWELVRTPAAVLLSGERRAGSTARLRFVALPGSSSRELSRVSLETVRALVDPLGRMSQVAPVTSHASYEALGANSEMLLVAAEGHSVSKRWARTAPGLRQFLKIEPSSTHDDRLRTVEIASIPIRARLVVLVACDAVFRSAEEGAGLDLASAFLVAGAGSVLAPQWKIPTGAATEAFVELFFEELRELGFEDAPGALARAQRAAIEKRMPSSVWAGWVLLAVG